MSLADLLAAASEEIATALSLRAGMEKHLPLAGRAGGRARLWLVRVAALGLVMAGISFGIAVVSSGTALARWSAMLGYSCLGVALFAAVGWASLLTLRTRPE
jgi:hypothetical protein